MWQIYLNLDILMEMLQTMQNQIFKHYAWTALIKERANDLQLPKFENFL